MITRRLQAVLFSALLMLTIGGKSSTYPQTEPKYSIHFVLPSAYVGVFRLVLDKQAGVDMKLENGRYTLEIPKDGTLKVRSFKPFAELHEKTAAYKSGEEIPHDPSGSLMPRSNALRQVWMVIGDMDESGEMVPPVVWTDIVGTKRQADSLKRRLQKEAEKLKPRLNNRGRV